MLISNYVHSIDTKSRVFIPAKFRLDLGLRFYVCYWELDGCLRAYNEAEWAELNEKLDKLTVKTVSVKRKILGEAAEVEMDSQGRFLLPEKLRDRVGITDSVQFVGMNKWVELWKPEKYEETVTAESEVDMSEVLSELGI